MCAKKDEGVSEEESNDDVREVTAEELLSMFRQSEIRSADRLIFLRSFEKFYNDVNNARIVLLGDLQEINAQIAARNQGVITNDAAESDAEKAKDE